jgi:hypothetical protein
MSFKLAYAAWLNGRRSMESLVRSVRRLQQRLLEADIPSVLIGGVAVALWGEPRVTRDVDLKIQLGRDEADRLLALLTPDYTALLPDPRRALREQAMLFVQDPAKTRLDLLLADTPYDVQAIRRGRSIELQPGESICVCSPEDLVIYKLVSTRLRDHEDAGSVVRRQGDKLDDSHVLHWLRQFEQALNDSTLVAEYTRLRAGK